MKGTAENLHTGKQRRDQGVTPSYFERLRVVQCSSGYTLIEILVAVSIMAIALVGILQLFSAGLKSSKLSDEYARGIFHAREVMEEILLSERISEGKLMGAFDDGYNWKAEIRRHEPEVQSKGAFDALEVHLSVIWNSLGGEKRFDLSTIRTIGNSSQ